MELRSHPEGADAVGSAVPDGCVATISSLELPSYLLLQGVLMKNKSTVSILHFQSFPNICLMENLILAVYFFSGGEAC